MKDSSDILIHEIIDDYQCPFTASEVHGFFTGLVLSNISSIDLDKKVLTFMDIDEGSLSKSRKLIKCIQSELKSSNLDIQSGDCLLYTSPSPRDLTTSRMPSSA